jgi:hypothetical protein
MEIISPQTACFFGEPLDLPVKADLFVQEVEPEVANIVWSGPGVRNKGRQRAQWFAWHTPPAKGIIPREDPHEVRPDKVPAAPDHLPQPQVRGSAKIKWNRLKYHKK